MSPVLMKLGDAIAGGTLLGERVRAAACGRDAAGVQDLRAGAAAADGDRNAGRVGAGGADAAVIDQRVVVARATDGEARAAGAARHRDLAVVDDGAAVLHQERLGGVGAQRGAAVHRNRHIGAARLRDHAGGSGVDAVAGHGGGGCRCCRRQACGMGPAGDQGCDGGADG